MLPESVVAMIPHRPPAFDIAGPIALNACVLLPDHTTPMTSRRLYIDQPLTAGQTLIIDGEPARYIGRVLRCRPGQTIVLFDGGGSEFPSVIETIARKGITFRIGDAVHRNVESPLALRLMQGLSRGERMDTVIQKATELGVHRLSPLDCEFSVVHLDDRRADRRTRHWRGICQSACEQCGRNTLPVLDAPATFAGAIADSGGQATRLLLHPGAAQSMQDIAPSTEVTLLIGPEGGFSDSELAQADEAGFKRVSLGPRTLRTETAAIAAIALAQALWGDLSVNGN
ncbi:MAG: 16S rRNA (uracil(1498)-N(3))-methyltransferase [Woeseiaceae bacterium]|nr:16S rRNA (uracil(1498)-N(3))-methyltransferase [Woeseiaceae bacterium]